jgi:hypothetical protein
MSKLSGILGNADVERIRQASSSPHALSTDCASCELCVQHN